MHITSKNNTGRVSTRRNAQRGGALLVAMILIFMLSIMGVSSMRGSTLERQMATNSIQTATTFQAAESTNEMAINQTANLSAAINIANVQAVKTGLLSDSQIIPFEADLLHGIDMESKAVLQYVGDGPAYGYSAGSGSSNFVAYRFEIKSSAKVESVRAKAFVTQGAYRVAPAR